MLTLRELMVEYILFAFDPEELMRQHSLTESEVADLADLDLLELYDQTVLRDL